MRGWLSIFVLVTVSLHFAAGQSSPGGPPTLAVQGIAGRAGSCGGSHRTWHYFKPVITLDTSNGYDPSLHRVWPSTEHPFVYRGGVMRFSYIPEMGSHITVGPEGQMLLCNITTSLAPLVECPLPPLRDERYQSGYDTVAVSFQATAIFPMGYTTTVTLSYPGVADGTAAVTFSYGCDPMYTPSPTRSDLPQVFASSNPAKESGPLCGVGAMSYVVLAPTDGHLADTPRPFDYPVVLYVSFVSGVDLTTTTMTASLVPISGHLKGATVACSVGAAPSPATGNGYHCDISSLMAGQWRDRGELNRVVRLELGSFGGREVDGDLTVVVNGGSGAANGNTLSGGTVPFGCAYGPDGCKPRSFTGYDSTCYVWGLPGDTCSVTGCDAVNSFTGAVAVTVSRDTSHVKCVGGDWVGHPRGCQQLPAPSAQPACGAQSFASHADSCVASVADAVCTLSMCAAAYTPVLNAMPDTFKCIDGLWVGEEVMCVLNVPPTVCGDPARNAYTIDCNPLSTPHATECRPTGCSIGHELADPAVPASGRLFCNNGVWEGEEFAGCVVSITNPVLGDCMGPLTLPTGYMATCPPGSPTPHGTSCTVECATGYFGTPVGSNMCFDALWYAHYSGCEQLCTLPASMCDPSTGKMVGGLVVRGLYGEQQVDDSCQLLAKGRSGLWRAECGGQYVLSNVTSRASLSPAFCVGGALIGGFAGAEGPPVCALRDDEVARECKCGKAGSVPRVSTRMVHGMFRANGYAVGENEWVCDRVDNFVQCRCHC